MHPPTPYFPILRIFLLPKQLHYEKRPFALRATVAFRL
jgi:hypothetical protein